MSESKLPVLQQEEQTTVGNYFVANYPPFSFWTPEQRDEAIGVLDRAPNPNTPLGLYIHIPFCRKRCHFCYFRVYTDRNAAEIRRYLDAVIAEVGMYAERAFIAGRKPQFIYFGGGTPSYLSAQQLTYLTDELKKKLAWDATREVTFECEPGTLQEHKLQAIHDFGVTRLSLGVEHFDEHILKVNNRAHGGKEIHRAYDWARKIGFDQINIDLIAGMMDETPAKWEACVAKAIELSPECITIYQMEVPYNTTIYQQMKAEGKVTAPVADWQTKRRWVKQAFEQLEAAGYTVGSAYTAVKDPNRTKFVYRDALWRGADMLGVGVSSFGHINGVHMQNQHNIGPYIEEVEANRLPIYRAMRMTREEQLVREFILQMKLGKVERAPFTEKFGIDPFIMFADQLRELESHGHIELTDVDLTFSRDGLLQVDRLLWSFFLPEHRQASRYA